MSRASKLAEQLKRLKGLNKPALDVLDRGAAQEAQLAELAAEEARKFQLSQAGDPLTHNPFESALKNIELNNLPENGFELVGGPQSKGFVLGEAGPISRPPVPYKASILEPEMQLPALSENRVGNTIDITDSALSAKLAGVDIPDPNSLKSKWGSYKEMAANNKGKIAGGLGAGAALSLGSLRPEDQMARASSTEVTADQPILKEIQEPLSEEEKELGRQMAHIQGSIGRPDAKVKSSIVDFGNGNSEANAENLRQAQNRENTLNFIANLGDTSKYLAYDIAGIPRPGELPGGENIRSIAKNQVSQYKDSVQFEKEDPNSPQSKGYRELAKSMGFEVKGNASAADLEKLFPQLSNISNQREAQAARKDMQRDKLEALRMQMATNKDNKSEQQKNKFITYAQTALGKEYGKYQTLENAFNSIEQAAGDKVGAGDVSILYNFIKSLDPNSVVREGEIALGRRGMSLAGRLRASTLGQFTGEMLDPAFRKDVMTIAKRMKDQGNTTYNQTANTIRDTAKQRYGMSDEDLTLIDPMLNRQAKEKKQMEGSRLPISDNTSKLINSRSEAENRKRMQELEQKYGKH